MDEELKARIDALERNVEVAYGLLSATRVALTALLGKHHDPEQLKLWLASLTELNDVQEEAAQASEARRSAARSFLEQLQRIEPMSGKIDPLRGSGLS